MVSWRGAQLMMSEIQLFGCSLCITYAGALLSLVVGSVMLLGFSAIGPKRDAWVRGRHSVSALRRKGKHGGSSRYARTPYAQGEADALAGRPCLYEQPMLGRSWSERLYYSGYHDTLNRIRREAREAESLR